MTLHYLELYFLDGYEALLTFQTTGEFLNSGVRSGVLLSFASLIQIKCGNAQTSLFNCVNLGPRIQFLIVYYSIVVLDTIHVNI